MQDHEQLPEDGPWRSLEEVRADAVLIVIGFEHGQRRYPSTHALVAGTY
jgi:hypothetical protein